VRADFWSLRAGLSAGAQLDCALERRGNSEARLTVSNSAETVRHEVAAGSLRRRRCCRSFGRAVSRLRDRMLFAEFYTWQSDRSFASEMRVIAAHIFAVVWVRTSLIMFGFTSFQP